MASGGEELLTIFKRIKTRVKQGSKNYDALYTIFSKRAELEERISSLIKGLIPSEVDKEDAIMVSVVNELRSEADVHSKFSQQLKQKVIQPMDKDNKQLKEQSKHLLADMKKTSTPVKKAVTDMHKTKKMLDDANSLMKTLPDSKKDAQAKKIQKLTTEAAQKTQKANQATDAIKGSSVPKIHQAFSRFDSDRMSKMQNYTVSFVASKKEAMNKILEGCSSLTTRATAIDSDDRSKRYVNNVFNTTGSGDVKENETNIVVALADYRSEEPRDLQFRRGDRIKVTLEHQSGWWEGIMEDGKRGLFPRSYVEILGAQRNVPITIGAIFNVYSDFKEPNGQSNYCDLLNGDLVYVDSLQRDGLCRGMNIRTSQKGLFPLETLEHVT